MEYNIENADRLGESPGQWAFFANKQRKMQRSATGELAFQQQIVHLTSNASHGLRSNLWTAYSQGRAEEKATRATDCEAICGLLIRKGEQRRMQREPRIAGQAVGGKDDDRDK